MWFDTWLKQNKSKKETDAYYYEKHKMYHTSNNQYWLDMFSYKSDVMTYNEKLRKIFNFKKLIISYR